jgi:hypothetical protein
MNNDKAIVPKYNLGDIVWRTSDAENIWWKVGEKPAKEAYDCKVTAILDEHDVDSQVWYVCTVYTYLDNYFCIVPERCLFETAEEAVKDSEKRYHAHKRMVAEAKKIGQEFAAKAVQARAVLDK